MWLLCRVVDGWGGIKEERGEREEREGGKGTYEGGGWRVLGCTTMVSNLEGTFFLYFLLVNSRGIV